jgi:predicted DNA-binding protein (MmcQ/YjbR family)
MDREAALSQLRATCAALPDTKEAVHFGDPVWTVRGKIFTSLGPVGEVDCITIQLDPAHADALVDSDARFVRYPRLKSLVCIAVESIGRWNEVGDLVEESYRLMAAPKQATSAGAKTASKAATKPAPAKPAAKAAPKKRR